MLAISQQLQQHTNSAAFYEDADESCVLEAIEKQAAPRIKKTAASAEQKATRSTRLQLAELIKTAALAANKELPRGNDLLVSTCSELMRVEAHPCCAQDTTPFGDWKLVSSESVSMLQDDLGCAGVAAQILLKQRSRVDHVQAAEIQDYLRRFFSTLTNVCNCHHMLLLATSSACLRIAKLSFQHVCAKLS